MRLLLALLGVGALAVLLIVTGPRPSDLSVVTARVTAGHVSALYLEEGGTLIAKADGETLLVDEVTPQEWDALIAVARAQPVVPAFMATSSLPAAPEVGTRMLLSFVPLAMLALAVILLVLRMQHRFQLR